MSTTSTAATLDAIPAAQAGLRARIGWICHLIRIAAVLWAGWNLVIVVRAGNSLGLDPARARLVANLDGMFQVSLSGISDAQVHSAFVLTVCVWILDAAVAYCIWRLTGTYLQGRIFTVDAAIWMRRLGLTGLSAVLAVVALRKTILFIYTINVHVPALKLLLLQPLALPSDLLRLVFCLFLLALAHIFKTAADLAADHAGIV